MRQQEPGGFDKKAFIAAVRAAIEAATPKNLEEGEKYKSSGKAAQVKDKVSGLVGTNKQAAEQAIKTTTNEAPDASKAKPKTVTPAKPEPVGPPPGSIGAGQAMPDPKSPAETDLRHDQCETEAQMKEADVTEEQLKKSNEEKIKKAKDWVKSKAKGAKEWAKEKLGIGQNDEKDGEGPERDQVVVKPFAMQGESHTLTLTLHDGKLRTRMASIDAGDLIDKVRDRQQHLPKKSKTAEDERRALGSIIEHYETGKTALDSLEDRATRVATKRKMAEQRARWSRWSSAMRITSNATISPEKSSASMKS